tara:strand:- start:716 stop:1414 length:699 start_codon:yes stop_codon:yes gene_type:complete
MPPRGQPQYHPSIPSGQPGSIKDWTLPEQQFFLHAFERHTAPFLQWPRYMQTLCHAGHLNMKQRFNATIMLLANGLAPNLIAIWFTLRGVLRDDAAREHVWSIMCSFRQGLLDHFSTYYFCATLPPSDEFPWGGQPDGNPYRPIGGRGPIFKLDGRTLAQKDNIRPMPPSETCSDTMGGCPHPNTHDCPWGQAKYVLKQMHALESRNYASKFVINEFILGTLSESSTSAYAH